MNRRCTLAVLSHAPCHFQFLSEFSLKTSTPFSKVSICMSDSCPPNVLVRRACKISLQFSRSVMSDSLQLDGLQYARLPCPSPTPRACSNSCPLSRWCHANISSSVIPFSSCLQSFPASGSFPMSQLYASDGQSIRASASAPVLPMNIQSWFPLGLTCLISLLSKGLSRVFFSTTVQKHQFPGIQSSLWSNSHMTIWTFVGKVMSLLLIPA